MSSLFRSVWLLTVYLHILSNCIYNGMTSLFQNVRRTARFAMTRPLVRKTTVTTVITLRVQRVQVSTIAAA